MGDELALIDWDAKKQFATAIAKEVYEKKLGNVDKNDFDGHETCGSKEAMIEVFQKYYGSRVTENAPVKIVRFELHHE